MTWMLEGDWWVGPSGNRLRAIAGGQEDVSFGGFLNFSPSDYDVGFEYGDPEPSFDFGQFDPGPMPFYLEPPEFAQPMGTGAEEAFPGASESPFAGGEENLAYDTTRGIVVDRISGREISPFRSGGQAGVDITGAVRGLPGLTQPGGRGTLSDINSFLGSNLGRLLAAGGLAGVGLGVQRAVAGSPPTLRTPTFTPSPATLAGQEALLRAYGAGAGPNLTRALVAATGGQAGIADQVAARVGRETLAEQELAPGQRDIRNLTLGILPGQIVPGAEQPFADPIQQALREEILGTLQGPGGVSPATGRRHQLEEQALRNRLFTQLGRDYDLSTEGIQALNDLKRRQNEEAYTERQATLARLTPLEENRMRFAAGFPTEQLGAREGIRRANVAQTAGLTDFGIRGTGENLNALRGIAPVSTLLGGNPDEANLINLNLANQAALEGFRSRVQSQRDLAAGVGGVFGTLAGAAGQRPSRLEELIGSSYGLQRTPSDFRFL